jgi:hypothetical protein
MYLNLNCRPMRAQTASSAALVDNRPEPALAISLHARRAGFSSRSTPAIGPIVQHNAMQECGRPARPLVEAAVPGHLPWPASREETRDDPHTGSMHWQVVCSRTCKAGGESWCVFTFPCRRFRSIQSIPTQYIQTESQNETGASIPAGCLMI